ncbi:unnamed protein product [Closterium sp. NIES-54]
MGQYTAAAAVSLKQLRALFDSHCFAHQDSQDAPVPIALLDTHSLSPDTLSHCHSFLLSSLHLPTTWPVFSIMSLLKLPGEMDAPAPASSPETDESPEKSPGKPSAGDSAAPSALIIFINAGCGVPAAGGDASAAAAASTGVGYGSCGFEPLFGPYNHKGRKGIGSRLALAHQHHWQAALLKLVGL